MPPVIRKRSRPLRRDISYRRVSGWTNPSTRKTRMDIGGTQITESEGHPWKPKQGFKGEDVGGDFYTIQRRYGDGRANIDDRQPQYVFGKETDAYYYFGPLFCRQPVALPAVSDAYFHTGYGDGHFPEDLSYSDETLMGYGTTAIARCKPTRSPANLSVGLAELFREGIPSLVGAGLWQDRAKNYRRYGDEFLNLQFGWLPLVNDIKNTARAISNGNELMKQYERDSGRLVRRGYDFPLEREVSTVELPATQGIYGADGRVLQNIWYVNNSTSRMKLFRERKITRKIWFRGAFTYYLPNDYNSRSKMDRASVFASEILGLEITPETIWNLAPWSWALDWVGNYGDVISNISDFASDGLVLRYGYLMENTIIKDTYTMTGAELLRYGATTVRNTFITEVKKRRRATPFGFGLDEGEFTPRQTAILAALGISRGPR